VSTLLVDSRTLRTVHDRLGQLHTQLGSIDTAATGFDGVLGGRALERQLRDFCDGSDEKVHGVGTQVVGLMCDLLCAVAHYDGTEHKVTSRGKHHVVHVAGGRRHWELRPHLPKIPHGKHDYKINGAPARLHKVVSRPGGGSGTTTIGGPPSRPSHPSGKPATHPAGTKSTTTGYGATSIGPGGKSWSTVTITKTTGPHGSGTTTIVYKSGESGSNPPPIPKLAPVRIHTPAPAKSGGSPPPSAPKHPAGGSGTTTIGGSGSGTTTIG
jgi:hypothetical protein